jgi:hypothetical protein
MGSSISGTGRLATSEAVSPEASLAHVRGAGCTEIKNQRGIGQDSRGGPGVSRRESGLKGLARAGFELNERLPQVPSDAKIRRC